MIQIPVALRGAGLAPFVAEDGDGPLEHLSAKRFRRFLRRSPAIREKQNRWSLSWFR
jgi:hypothetical protein